MVSAQDARTECCWEKAELAGHLLNTVRDKIPISVNVAPSRSWVKKKKDVTKSEIATFEKGVEGNSPKTYRTQSHNGGHQQSCPNPQF